MPNCSNNSADRHEDKQNKLLVIACGNALRQDDGAGHVLAERLIERWRKHDVATRLLSVQQLVPELAEEIADPSLTAVLFVDVTVGQQSLLQRVEPHLEASSTRAISHALSPAVLLLYAELLHKRVPPGWLLTVQGMAFEHGSELSGSTREAIAHIEQQSDSILAQLTKLVRQRGHVLVE